MLWAAGLVAGRPGTVARLGRLAPTYRALNRGARVADLAQRLPPITPKGPLRGPGPRRYSP